MEKRNRIIWLVMTLLVVAVTLPVAEANAQTNADEWRCRNNVADSGVKELFTRIWQPYGVDPKTRWLQEAGCGGGSPTASNISLTSSDEWRCGQKIANPEVRQTFIDFWGSRGFDPRSKWLQEAGCVPPLQAINAEDRANIVDVAANEIGVCEPESYDRYTQSNLVEWCWDFVVWVYKQASVPLDIEITERKQCDVLRWWFEVRNSWIPNGPEANPSPGDYVLFMYWDVGGAHASIVEKVEGDTLYTIDGNAEVEGTEVDCVVRYKHEFFRWNRSIVGFGHR